MGSLLCYQNKREVNFEKLLANMKDEGDALIINLKGKGYIVQKIVVQAIIAKLQKFLESSQSYPLFILAEEAHLYISQTSWLDLITRMRHLGAFQLYITNTLTSIDQLIIRQTDNTFIFNLTNPKDIEHILPAAKIDKAIMELVAPALPPKTFLAIGQAASDYPFILKTKPLPYLTAGKTRLLWKR